MPETDEHALSRLRQFSYRCESQQGAGVLRDAAAAVLPEETSPLLCVGVAFLAAFAATALCCIGRGGTLDGGALPAGVLSAVIVLLGVHVAAAATADAFAQRPAGSSSSSGGATAAFVLARHGLRGATLGLLLTALCYGCALPPAVAPVVVCGAQAALYAVHWAHHLTGRFHSAGPLRPAMLAVPFAVALLAADSQTRAPPAAAATAHAALARTVLVAVGGGAGLVTLVQALCVARARRGRRLARPCTAPAQYLLPAALHAVLGLLWYALDPRAFAAAPFFYLQTYTWLFAATLLRLVVADMLARAPPLGGWPQVALAACCAATRLAPVDPRLVAALAAALSFAAATYAFFSTAAAVQDYLARNPNTPLALPGDDDDDDGSDDATKGRVQEQQEAAF